MLMREETIGSILERMAEEYPSTEALVYPDRHLRLSYKDFNHSCRQLAKGFMQLGIKRGEHMAVWATNCPEWVTTQFATGKMGAVLVTVNTNYQQSELAYLLKQSDTTTLLVMEGYKGTSYLEMLYRLIPELQAAEPGKLESAEFPYLKHIVYLGKERKPGMWLYDDIVKMGDQVTDAALDRLMSELDVDDAINMQYTSGTTGFPKGVMLTHRNLIHNASNIAACMGLSQQDRLCIPVPFFHCFGCVLGTLACVSVAATMVPVEEFHPEKVLQTVQAEKCTALHGVPTMFIAELNLPTFDTYDLSSLRTGIMAGSNCPVEVMKDVIEKMGITEITIAYGQTESSPVITQTRVDDSLERRTDTVGRALPNVEVKIVDPDTQEEVAAGVQGELLTRGYHVMKGYYKQPEETAKVLTGDGWLHTGDLAIMDEDGYCKITGRLKDMIIRGGENIYPREIEEFLYTHPAILDVQVVGLPDPKYGEIVSAWIRLKADHSLTAADVQDYCKGQIAHFKIPQVVEFVDHFPMTASGKVQKFKLREQKEKQEEKA